MKNLLKDLVLTFGPSGNEGAIRDKIEKYLSKCNLKVKSDPLGNIWGIKQGKTDKVLLIDAHMDEIALMVSYFEKDGFIKFVTIGGFDQRIFPGNEVIIHGKKEIKGIITSIPPHLQRDSSKTAWMKSELFIDTGLSENELKNNIRIGDYISFPKHLDELIGGRYSGNSLDNRIGVSILIDIASNIKKQPYFTVVFGASFSEEVGLRGGKTLGYNVKPDLGICFDVSYGDFPGISKTTSTLGKGPIISLGPAYHPVFIDFIVKEAKQSKIKFQQEVESRPGGTHAGPIQLSHLGCGVAGISIPLRNMHTPVEVVDIKDMQNTSKLIQNVIQKIKPDILEKIRCY